MKKLRQAQEIGKGAAAGEAEGSMREVIQTSLDG